MAASSSSEAPPREENISGEENQPEDVPSRSTDTWEYPLPLIEDPLPIEDSLQILNSIGWDEPDPANIEISPSVLSRLSFDQRDFVIGRAQAIIHDLTEKGELDDSHMEFWRLMGYDPSFYREGADTTTIIPSIVLEIRNHIGWIERYLSLPATGDLDELVKNYKKKYYTLDCLDHHDVDFCWVPSVFHNNLYMIEMMLRNPELRPLVTESMLNTALISTAKRGYLRLVGYLLPIVDDIPTINFALVSAYHRRYPEITKLLKSRATAYQRANLLFQAIEYYWLPMMEILYFPEAQYQPGDGFNSVLRYLIEEGRYYTLHDLIRIAHQHELSTIENRTSNADQLFLIAILSSAAEYGTLKLFIYLFSAIMDPTVNLDNMESTAVPNPYSEYYMERAARAATSNQSSAATMFPYDEPSTWQVIHRLWLHDFTDSYLDPAMHSAMVQRCFILSITFRNRSVFTFLLQYIQRRQVKIEPISVLRTALKSPYVDISTLAQLVNLCFQQNPDLDVNLILFLSSDPLNFHENLDIAQNMAIYNLLLSHPISIPTLNRLLSNAVAAKNSSLIESIFLNYRSKIDPAIVNDLFQPGTSNLSIISLLLPYVTDQVKLEQALLFYAKQQNLSSPEIVEKLFLTLAQRITNPEVIKQAFISTGDPLIQKILVNFIDDVDLLGTTLISVITHPQLYTREIVETILKKIPRSSYFFQGFELAVNQGNSTLLQLFLQYPIPSDILDAAFMREYQRGRLSTMKILSPFIRNPAIAAQVQRENPPIYNYLVSPLVTIDPKLTLDEKVNQLLNALREQDIAKVQALAGFPNVIERTIGQLFGVNLWSSLPYLIYYTGGDPRDINTALVWAARHGSLLLVRSLLQQGADKDILKKQGSNTSWQSVVDPFSADRWKIIELLS